MKICHSMGAEMERTVLKKGIFVYLGLGQQIVTQDTGHRPSITDDKCTLMTSICLYEKALWEKQILQVQYIKQLL